MELRNSLALLLIWQISVGALPVAVPAPFPGGVGPDGTRYKTAYRCEGERLELACPADHRIKIIRANFGRFSIAICNNHGKMDLSVNCMAPSSTRVMRKRCDDKSNCSIEINSGLFLTDPCPATPKYLEVHYGCVPTATTTTKRPLPPWFLQGGGNSLWDSRIPDPPEGFKDPLKPEAEEKLDDPLNRIPITTPNTPESSTTTTTTSTTTTTTTTSTTETEDEDDDTTSPAEGMEYFHLNPSSSDLEVSIVDIPLADQPLHCPPAIARNLQWNWTAAGDTALQPCPPGSTGLARWTCGTPKDADSPVFWATAQPDMGDCKTLTMSRLEAKVQSGDLENVISSSLAHLTRTESLYGGDIEQSAAVMRTLANRIQYLLQTQGDTFYNKGIYIQEVLLNMVRSASNLLDAANRAAWRDLTAERQVKAANSILQALEENAFLFAEVENKEEILMESAKNIYMSVTIQEVGRLNNGTRLTAEKDSNSILLPFNVLWDQARAGIIKLVHFSFDNVHEILGAADIKVSNSGGAAAAAQPLKLNSRLVSASFGRTTGRIKFPNTVEVTLDHLTPVADLDSTVCVSWSSEMSAWTDAGCSLVVTSATETRCACDHMSVYGLAARLGASAARPGFSIMTLQIVTYIVAGISVICVVLILVKFRRGLVRFVCKVSKSSEKHVCNPKAANIQANDAHHTIHNNLQRNLNPEGGKGPEFVIQGQDGTMTILPNVYKTSLEHSGQPVMVTLNPYSSQLVDNLNRMMKEEEENAASMNPQLARLTATLRKKRCELGHPGPCRPTCGGFGGGENTLQMADRSSRLINPTDVVFRAVSPHGHVYWEINPKEGQQQQHQVMVAGGKSAASSGDENTNTGSDLQNVSDFSDSDDHRAHSEMSRQSSSRFSESRPLIYTSSASTSPGHSNGSHAHIDAARAQLDAASNFHATTGQRPKFGRGTVSGRWPTLPPNFHEEVYAYAATDFGHQGGSSVPETVQSQVQIKDLRTLPVTVKSKEYIMAKIADYTERNTPNHV